MLPQPKNIEFEKREDSYVLVCRNMNKLKGFVNLLVIGLIWFSSIQSLKGQDYNSRQLFSSIGALFCSYILFFITFGKSIIEVSKERISLHKIQFPFPTKKVIETKDIEEILCEKSNWVGSYNVKAKLKSGKKIKLFETSNRDDAQFLLTALDSSVKQSHKLLNEKIVAPLIRNKLL